MCVEMAASRSENDSATKKNLSKNVLQMKVGNLCYNILVNTVVITKKIKKDCEDKLQAKICSLRTRHRNVCSDMSLKLLGRDTLSYYSRLAQNMG